MGNGDDDSLDEKKAAENHSVEDDVDATEEASVEEKTEGVGEDEMDKVKGISDKDADKKVEIEDTADEGDGKKGEVDGTAVDDTDSKEEKRTEEEYADRMKDSERRADDDTKRKDAELADNNLKENEL